MKRSSLDGLSVGPPKKTTIGPQASTSSRWFASSIAAIVVIGAAGVGVLALSRESVVGIAPQAGRDHWHSAITIYDCDGQALPPTTNTDHGDGIHSHADSLIHIHPSNPSSSGPNATLGSYLSASGAALSNDSYLPGRGEPTSSAISEGEGCGDSNSELQMAVWDAADTQAEPTIITSNFDQYRLSKDNQIIAIGLVGEGDALSNELGSQLLASHQSG